jgi:hypothetical protein
MEKAGNIIQRRLNHHQISESARAAEVVFKANQYLSTWLKCETEDARATSLKEGILWISTGSAVWSQEAHGVASPLLKKLQSEYGEMYVKKVRIRSVAMQQKNCEMAHYSS